jgi:hypothetical protein
MKNISIMLTLLMIMVSLSLRSQTLKNTKWIIYDTSGTFFSYDYFGNDTLSYSTDNLNYQILSAFSIDSNKIILKDFSPYSCSYFIGKYTFKIENDTLKFSLIYDTCSSRTTVLTTYLWKKIPTGIQTENNLANFISVFPNPTNNILTIETNPKFNNYTYIITDIFGRVVIVGKLNSKISLNLTDLSNGTYYLHVRDISTPGISFIKY